MVITMDRVVRRAIALVLLSACSNPAGIQPPPGPTPSACTFTNPIGSGADPWIVRDGNSYYLVESRDNGIYVYKSGTLTSPKLNGVKVWAAPDTGWNRTNVWAPELHPINGKWYIYYAAGRAGPPFIYQRAGVLESAGSDPQGAYADKGMLYTGPDAAADTANVWAIDLTVQQLDGQLYAVWSGWDRNALTDRTPQNLYIAKMSNPWTISSNRVLLTTPSASWERGTELDLEEGPEFLEHNGQTFIIYSTRESWLPEYKLGQLRLTAGANPMNASSYIKTGPVFTGTTGVYGVGHASFTTSIDNTENWIVYHSKVDPSPGWDRVIRAQKFTWNADGSPNFGDPVQSAKGISLPSGDCR